MLQRTCEVETSSPNHATSSSNTTSSSSSTSLLNKRISAPGSSRQSLLASQQCIFFLGCPFLGKTSHYESIYELKGFERISFETDRNKNISRMFDLLSQNRKIVIDDEKTMSSSEARKKLVEKIKTDQPQCSIECITFYPKYGDLQIEIAKIFHLCEYFELNNFEMNERFESLNQFLKEIITSREEENSSTSSILTHPAPEEGFGKISSQGLPLFVNRRESDFCYQSLIIDACSSNLFTYDSKKRKVQFKNPSVIRSQLLKWSETFHEPRVIFIFKDKESFRVSLNIPANHVNSLNVMHLLRDTIVDLGLPFPIYYCTDSESRNLVHIFCQIFYMYSIRMEESLFVTDLPQQDIPNDIFRIFSKLHVTDHSTLFADEQHHDFQTLLSSPPQNHNLPAITLQFLPNSKSVDAPKSRRYPLLNQLNDNENVTDQPYFEYQKRGMQHGIVLPRNFISYFEYKEDFFEHEILITTIMEDDENAEYADQRKAILFGDEDLDKMMQDEDDTESQDALAKLQYLRELRKKSDEKTEVTTAATMKNEAIPSRSKTDRAVTQSSSKISEVTDPFGNKGSTTMKSQSGDGMELSTASQIENAFPSQNASSSTVYTTVVDSSILSQLRINMSIFHIMNHFGAVYFQRGRDYKNEYRIDNFRTKIINNIAFKLYSTCIGSREEPYKQESIIKDGKLLKAICNCPIGSEGLCKHVCAQILAFREKEQYTKEKSEYLNVSKSERKLPPPIAFTMLEPILDDWCVKVKVIKKHNEKTWANERGSGRVCAITVEDELSSKRLKVIMFNDLINEFYDKMEEGEIYYINKGHLIKKTNDDMYEIQLCANSVVRNIHEVGVKFKDTTSKNATDFKKIFNEVVEMPHQHGIQFEEFKPSTSLSTTAASNMPQNSTSSSSFIAPSPEKKRKHMDAMNENTAGSHMTNHDDILENEQISKPALQLAPNESPSKKKKQNASPSIDTRFEHILNGLPTQESQHSIIASQPILANSLFHPSHHSVPSQQSSSSNESQRSKSSVGTVIAPTLVVDKSRSSPEALSPVLFTGIGMKYQQPHTSPTLTLCDHSEEEEEDSQHPCELVDISRETAPEVTLSSTSNNSHEIAISMVNPKNNPSQNTTTENIISSTTTTNGNNTTCGNSPLSSTTPKGVFFFVDEEEDTNSHISSSTSLLQDIFFTPHKSKLASEASSHRSMDFFSGRALASPPLLSDANVEEIISSTDNMLQPQEAPQEERPKSPHSLSQHNKPPVVEVVYLSDNDGVEILEHATPQKRNKKSTRRSITSLTSSPGIMLEEEITPLLTTPPLANLTLSTPPQQPSSSSSTLSSSATSSSSSTLKTPKKVSLKFLLDNNDMSDL